MVDLALRIVLLSERERPWPDAGGVLLCRSCLRAALMHPSHERQRITFMMDIECITLFGATEVLLLLQAAGLQSGSAFHVTGPHPPVPPIHFTFSEAPPTDLLEQLKTIPDINIVEAA